MSDLELKAAHEETRDAWNVNAAYWDERMGEGNDFVEVLIWPALQRMLDVAAPASACWRWRAATGFMPRRLADAGRRGRRHGLCARR